MRRPRILPEYQRRERVRKASFIPGERASEFEVERFTIWARSENGERRADTRDMRALGYQRNPRKKS